MLRLYCRCGIVGRVAIIWGATSEPFFAVRREPRVKVGATIF
jgi:rRNA processing protein Gar1